jgi:hypothetical protein
MIHSPELGFALPVVLFLIGSYFAYRIGLSVGNTRALDRVLAQINRQKGTDRG